MQSNTLLLVNRTSFTFKNGSATATKLHFLLPGGNSIYYVDWDGQSGDLFVDGCGYLVSYSPGNFNGEARMESISSAEKVEVDLVNYVKASKIPLNQLKATILDAIDAMVNQEIAELSSAMLHPDMFTFPAAKSVHNNWRSGLAEHIVALLTLAKPVYEHYARYFPSISFDKIAFGCIFHDYGKIYEYQQNGVAYDISRGGELVPHIVRAGNEIEVIGRQQGMDRGLMDELIHIVSSHHGRLEYGSPVEPKTVEARIVHELDMLDSKMMHIYGLFDANEGEKVYSPTHRINYVVGKIS